MEIGADNCRLGFCHVLMGFGLGEASLMEVVDPIESKVPSGDVGNT